MDFGHFQIDEGVNKDTGIRTIYRFEGDQVTVQKVYDAEPYLQRAAEMRARNEGKRWGEGREVGVIPPWAMRDIAPIKDDKEREKAIRLFFHENPAFLAYDAYLK